MQVALDSNVFIAALSPHELHSRVAQQLIRDIASGRHIAVASSIAYGEVLGVSGTDMSTDGLDIEGFFNQIENLSTFPANDEVCLAAGVMRKKYGSKLKLPDALHLATALQAGAEVFITNDVVLARIARQVMPTTVLAEWK